MTLNTIRRLSILTAALGIATGAAAQSATPETPAAKPMPGGAIEAAFKRADANGDGKVSKEEAARMPAVAESFAQHDRNGDGALDMAEFLAGYSPGKSSAKP